jgi:FkbM family methyltransferase
MMEAMRKLLRGLGFDIVRYPPLHSHSGRMKRLFTHYRVDMVIDVGANKGQFGLSLRELGYKGPIVSFEPLSDAHRTLVATAAPDPHWKVAPPMAIGRARGQATINVAANSESSSILPMSSLHSDAAPTSKYTATETVDVNALDDAASAYLVAGSNIFVKVDTQGFEAEVLAGAPRLLERAVGVQLEMSLGDLYDGQPGYLDLIQTMKENGFALAELMPGFSDPRTGHLLQSDGIFFRKKP